MTIYYMRSIWSNSCSATTLQNELLVLFLLGFELDSTGSLIPPLKEKLTMSEAQCLMKETPPCIHDWTVKGQSVTLNLIAQVWVRLLMRATLCFYNVFNAFVDVIWSLNVKLSSEGRCLRNTAQLSFRFHLQTKVFEEVCVLNVLLKHNIWIPYLLCMWNGLNEIGCIWSQKKISGKLCLNYPGDVLLTGYLAMSRTWGKSELMVHQCPQGWISISWAWQSQWCLLKSHL